MNFLQNLLIRTVGCANPYSKFMVAVVYELISLVSSSDIQKIICSVLLRGTVCCANSYRKFKVAVTASAISAEWVVDYLNWLQLLIRDQLEYLASSVSY